MPFGTHYEFREPSTAFQYNVSHAMEGKYRRIRTKEMSAKDLTQHSGSPLHPNQQQVPVGGRRKTTLPGLNISKAQAPCCFLHLGLRCNNLLLAIGLMRTGLSTSRLCASRIFFYGQGMQQNCQHYRTEIVHVISSALVRGETRER